MERLDRQWHQQTQEPKADMHLNGAAELPQSLHIIAIFRSLFFSGDFINYPKQNKKNSTDF